MKKAIFHYPSHFILYPDYSEHRGQVVTVLRELTIEECNDPEITMYKIEASDGWVGDAFEDELEFIE